MGARLNERGKLGDGPIDGSKETRLQKYHKRFSPRKFRPALRDAFSAGFSLAAFPIFQETARQVDPRAETVLPPVVTQTSK